MNKNLVSMAGLALLLTSAAAHADGNGMQTFLGLLEGHWDASGLIHKLDADGRMVDTHYTGEMQVDRSNDADWALSSQLTDENGLVTQNNGNLSVRGELLFASASGVSEPVQVLESTDSSLTYQFRRVDALTGREYVFTFHDELDASHDALKGHNTVQTNNVTFIDETFTAKRW